MEQPEPKSYGNSIIDALKQAGWAVQQNHMIAYGPAATPHGLIRRAAPHPDAAVEALRHAFQKAGIVLKLEVADAQQDSFIELRIGLKD